MTISANYPAVAPSLDLDFANSRQLDPRISYSRSTTGTYYDGQTSAVAEQNLLTYSQDFTNAVWVTAGVGSTGPTKSTTTDTLPDGTTGTVGTLTFPIVAASQTSFVYQNNGSSQLNIQNTGSVYVRVASGSATIFLNFEDVGAGPSGGNFVAGAAQTVTTSWTRISLTGTRTSNTGNQIFCIGFDTRSSSGQTNASSFTLQVWGAQFEQKSAAGPYTATTTSTVTNYIPQLLTAPVNQPRFDFNPTTRASLGLLMEQQSTNLVTYSSQFDNAAWTKSNSSVTADTIIAPDGTLTGDKWIPTTTGTISTSRLYEQITVSSGTVYTTTVYVKYSGRRWVFMAVNDTSSSIYYCWFDVLNGVVGTKAGSVTSTSITPVGNNWYRISATYTASVATNYFYISSSDADNSTTVTADGVSGVYVWGAQLEALAFPTSYIPTTTSQVTRAQDFATMTGTNFSSWFNNNQGTVYCSGDMANIGTPAMSLWGIDNNSTQGYIALRIFSTNLSVFVGSTSRDLGTVTANTTQQSTFTYNNISPMTASGSLNGATALAVSSPTQLSYVPTQLSLGKYLSNSNPITGHIRKFAYYPIATTSTNLQALTGS
jgi:hypothetical protein